MKKSIYIIAVLGLLLSACKKENQFPSQTVDVSNPTITITGDPVVILNIGDAYTDQGATYYDSLYGDNGNISTNTVVNTDVEGFFIVTYTATNKYGFEGSGTRLVAVTTASDALDVSGTYIRAVTGFDAEITKVGRGVFKTSNAGGNASYDEVYFMFKGDSTVVMPSQLLPVSLVQARFADVAYDFDAGTLTYTILASGFGDAPRIFEKQ